MTWRLTFTARKRAPWGERYRWHHVYGERAEAEEARERLRKRPDYRGRVRIEIREGGR